MDIPILKYPRTRHVEGSRLQPGDEDLLAVPMRDLIGRHVVVEEKVDGANCGLSFSPNAQLMLQSRGHYLTGGPRERHFALLKQWASVIADRLIDVVGDRYLVYGEWLYAKHTVFYDALPHYFMEFDVFDRSTERFLDTPSRARLLGGLPITPVKVLFSGVLKSRDDLVQLLGLSAFKTTSHAESLRAVARKYRLDEEQILRETNLSPKMEGLYIKVEEEGYVVDRLKFVRPDFLTSIADSGKHWLERPIVPNQLAPGVELFGAEGGAT